MTGEYNQSAAPLNSIAAMANSSCKCTTLRTSASVVAEYSCVETRQSSQTHTPSVLIADNNLTLINNQGVIYGPLMCDPLMCVKSHKSKT